MLTAKARSPARGAALQVCPCSLSLPRWHRPIAEPQWAARSCGTKQIPAGDARGTWAGLCMGLL